MTIAQVEQRERDGLLAEYERLIGRPDLEPGDDLRLAKLKRELNALGVTDIDPDADRAARATYEQLAAGVMTAEQRADVRREAQARALAGARQQREYLAELIGQMPVDAEPAIAQLDRIFHAVNLELIAVQQGSHIARAAKWDEMKAAAHQAKASTANTLGRDADAVRQMADLKKRHPRAFGLKPAAPKPAASPVIARDGDVVFSGGGICATR